MVDFGEGGRKPETFLAAVKEVGVPRLNQWGKTVVPLKVERVAEDGKSMQLDTLFLSGGSEEVLKKMLEPIELGKSTRITAVGRNVKKIENLDVAQVEFVRPSVSESSASPSSSSLPSLSVNGEKPIAWREFLELVHRWVGQLMEEEKKKEDSTAFL